MGFTGKILTLFCLALLLGLISPPPTAQAFNCSTSGGTVCNSIIDYVSPNSTTLGAIANLFGVKHFAFLLGANNLNLSTPNTTSFAANQTIKIPFPCRCFNGSGISNRVPVYTVVPGDGLYHIAAEVFSGLVVFQDIQRVNNIPNPNLIEVGQKLLIPLPCSCDQVDRQYVVHYGHVVPAGSTVEGIALQYNTSADTLLRLNGMTNSSQLLAGKVLDVPLRVCTSMVNNNSQDYPLLVPNGTYTLTASQCVECTCDAAMNWVLQCQPSQINSTSRGSCPSMQCQGANILDLGQSTSIACNRTTCAYAGYGNQTISTIPVSESTCPAPNNNSASFKLQGWRWNFLILSIHVLLLCVHLLHWDI